MAKRPLLTSKDIRKEKIQKKLNAARTGHGQFRLGITDRLARGKERGVARLMYRKFLQR